MNTCEHCNNFEPCGQTDIHGQCKSGKMIEGGCMSDVPSDCVVGGGCDGYGDFIYVGKDFGCIHWEAKEKFCECEEARMVHCIANYVVCGCCGKHIKQTPPTDKG